MFNWYALYTKSRHEKFIHSELSKRHNIESFLPTRKIKRRWSDRTKRIEEPLFKGYLFVKTDLFQRIDVLKIKGAVEFVRAGRDPIPVAEKVILSLRKLIQQEIALDPFPYLNVGDRVYVKSGPFRGSDGYLIRKNDKKCRLVISLDLIRSSISIEIDSALVEKV